MRKFVKFTNSSIDQVRWGGNDDPTTVLVIGKRYEVLMEEVHDWHTKYILVRFPKLKFNSCSFEPSRLSEGYNYYKKETICAANHS